MQTLNPTNWLYWGQPNPQFAWHLYHLATWWRTKNQHLLIWLWKKSGDLSPQDQKTYSNWCLKILNFTVVSTWRARWLPKGLFLICGNQAWVGIPPHPRGGPCTIGKLSFLAPGKDQLLSWWEPNSTRLQKRATHYLASNCDDSVISWSLSKRILASLFLPCVVAAKALGELTHLECWVGKQENQTSLVLTELLEDEETMRQAMLQNQAAIDYLLLQHGHGCEEFNGLCCFNLSSPSKNIVAHIQEIRDHVHKLETQPKHWFDGLFEHWGISGWGSSLFQFLSQIISIFILLIVY